MQFNGIYTLYHLVLTLTPAEIIFTLNIKRTHFSPLNAAECGWPRIALALFPHSNFSHNFFNSSTTAWNIRSTREKSELYWSCSAAAADSSSVFPTSARPYSPTENFPSIVCAASFSCCCWWRWCFLLLLLPLLCRPFVTIIPLLYEFRGLDHQPAIILSSFLSASVSSQRHGDDCSFQESRAEWCEWTTLSAFYFPSFFLVFLLFRLPPLSSSLLIPRIHYRSPHYGLHSFMTLSWKHRSRRRDGELFSKCD